MTVDEFKQKILAESFDEIVENVLLADDAMHVSKENHDFIKSKLADTYRVEKTNINMVIVGSAKLGFAIAEKKLKDGTVLPRYRLFRPDSDIDIAVISPGIYEAIWNELSRFAFGQPYLPWDSGKLGDYMVCGWLRPDHFPKERRLRKCDSWWDTFRLLSSQQKLGRRQIRGGLFYNFEHLKTYQGKALADCIDFEKMQL